MPTEDKIKLLHVITKLELGGAQKHVLDLLEGLDRDRFDLFLFSADEGYCVDRALQVPGLHFHRSRSLERPIHLVKDLFALIEIIRFIKKHKIEIVHTHSSKAGVLGRLAAKLAGVRMTAHTVHGWSFYGMRNPLFRFFAIGLEKILARWTDVLCVVAQADEGKGLKAGIIPRRKYVLARCGIRTETFSPDDRGRARTQLGFQADDHVVGMVACLKPQKAPTDFVKLAAVVKRKMPKAKFMLVGDGVLRNDLERQIRAAGLEKDIVLTGWRQDVPALLSIMDVFVLTSLWEGLPIAVLEAMAAQVPVVVTDTGGVRDVVDDGRTGFLMAQGDVLGMCEKIVTLAKAPVLKRQMVEAAKARVMAEEFSLPKTVRAVEMVYGEMIGKGHDVR